MRLGLCNVIWCGFSVRVALWQARNLPSPSVPDYDVGIYDSVQFDALLSLGHTISNQFGHCATFLKNSTIVFLVFYPLVY
jgi:hypothetical protein